MFETNSYELSSDVLLCIHIQVPNAHEVFPARQRKCHQKVDQSDGWKIYATCQHYRLTYG